MELHQRQGCVDTFNRALRNNIFNSLFYHFYRGSAQSFRGITRNDNSRHVYSGHLPVARLLIRNLGHEYHVSYLCSGSGEGLNARPVIAKVEKVTPSLAAPTVETAQS